MIAVGLAAVLTIAFTLTGTLPLGWSIAVVVGVLSVLGAVLIHVLASELQGWMEIWSRKLVHLAARRLGEQAEVRYQDEWLAELEEFYRRPISAVAWALQLNVGARSLRTQLTGRKMTRRATRREEMAILAGDVLFIFWRVAYACLYVGMIGVLATVAGVVSLISGDSNAALAVMLTILGSGLVLGVALLFPWWWKTRSAWTERLRQTERVVD